MCPPVVEISPDHRSRSAEVFPANLPEKEIPELIALSRLGDEAAFTELVRRIRGPIKILAKRMAHNSDDAADIVQLTLIKVWGNLASFDTSKPFNTWLYRITINAGIDYMRKNNRHKHEQLDVVDLFRTTSLSEPEAALNRVRLKHHVTSAGTRLKLKQQTALQLRDVEGNTIDQVAKVMNMPEATTRWHLHQGRTILRKELRRRCPDLLHAFGIK